MKAKRGMTLVELVVIIVAVVLLLGLLMLLPRSRATAHPIKCATNVRDLVQACLIWSQQNKDQFPLPSRVDLKGTTIGGLGPEAARIKDNTGNMLSILIWNGLLTPEQCVSPQESNGAIVMDTGYQSTNPERAAAAGGDPNQALWDPGFSGTPDAQEVGYRRALGRGNVSYAHAIPLGAPRAAKWANTFSGIEPVWGNRGPTYEGAPEDFGPCDSSGWILARGPLGVGSNTLLIHGARNTWEGSIGYNDGHVNFETRPDPSEITYLRAGTAGPTVARDNLFVDESDDATAPAGSTARDVNGSNAYLRLISNVSGTDAGYVVGMFRD